MENKVFVKCPKCKNVYNLDSKIVNEKYIQCPFPLCCAIFENPLNNNQDE